MRLTILGGSAAGPNPGQGCSGYLIESGSTRVVLDLGSGTFPKLRRHVDFRRLDAVVISHLHLDHFLDVLALRFALAYNPIAPTRPLPLWLPPGGTAFLKGLAAAISGTLESEEFFSDFKPGEFNPETALTIGELTIRFHLTVHFVPCWAMRVSNDVDGELFYTADTGPAASPASFGREAHIVIAEETERRQSPRPSRSRGHLTPVEAGTLAKNTGAKMPVLSHLWVEHDPFSAIAEAQEAFGSPVELATPGLHLTWTGVDD